ncbi:MAG: sigma-70 family RNA polymerase sigma factor [Patescibacteria group bacterium]|nr:sigma-70 family RNA polymerase sigma factor [Patescibacteria group bacterium]
METATIAAPVEIKEEPLIIPADLLPNLKPNAPLVINDARKNGKISTRGIAAIVRSDSVSDRYKLRSTVSLLDKFLLSIGLSIARGSADIQMRQIPLPHFNSRATLSINFGKLKESDVRFLSSLEKEEIEFDSDALALYKEVIRRYPVLSNVEVIGLFKEREKGDLGAHHLLILHNLKLVFALAMKHQNKGLDLPDLVQEGIIGLMTAIEKFKWQWGYHLSTYATWWVRQRMTRAIIDKARSIRLPAYVATKYYVILRTMNSLAAELGRDPSHEEIAQKMDVPTPFITKLLHSVWGTEPESMNDTITHDEDSKERQDLLADGRAITPSSALEAKEALEEVVGEVRGILIKLATLPRFDDRWRSIFRMRYGLDGVFFARPTLEIVGLKFGVTRERIRQIVEACWVRLNAIGVKGDDDWFVAKLAQIEELESIVGTLTKI